MYTDFNQKIIEKIPERFRPYAVLARIDRPIGIWLLMLPGWWAVVLAAGGLWDMTLWDWWVFVLFGIGAVVMRGAGCVVNDLWDRDLDQQVGRTRLRPLASGEISKQQAMVFLGGLLAAGFLILIQLGWVTIILGVLSLPLIALYPLMKRYTWWPQAFLGITFNFGALMGWSAVTDGLSWTSFFLYAGGILWTLGYDTIYAHQDKDDDALAGIKSSALRLGANSKKAVAGFYAGAWVLIAAGGIFADFHSLAFLFLLPAMGHLIVQIFTWNPDEPESCLRVFKSNRNFGLMVLAAFALA